MDVLEKKLLAEIADLHDVPAGAYNLRKNGEGAARQNSANIEIVTKEDKPGIDIIIKPGTKNESVHIPVIITQSGLDDMVYNDFYVGEDADVLIVAGCGIHNSGCETSKHSGIHTFHLGKNSRMRYVEKHYGEGEGEGERILNPDTIIYQEEGSVCILDSSQIKGVDSTKRYTKVVLGKNAELQVTEKLLTHNKQNAESEMDVILQGEGSKARIISRSVAQDESVQVFYPRLIGECECFGHVQCDSIIMGKARVRSIPEIAANDVDAQLVHEAAIGRIAGDQIVKMMTLGLTEEEAEEKILSGFLK
ncbi:MAG: SufD family Fe-S cluster assembly protein [Oscillospiraceae bacterium]|nr:SufD family Fe-S cluster assembly protein [Oscillospiraceae bacterium]